MNHSWEPQRVLHIGRVWLPASSPTRPARDECGLFGCLVLLFGLHSTMFKAALGLPHWERTNRQFLQGQARAVHVGGGGCTRAATLEKPRCFPKRRQLLTSPPLTAPSPDSPPLSQLSPAEADQSRARRPPDSITGERIITWPVAMAVSTSLCLTCTTFSRSIRR